MEEKKRVVITGIGITSPLGIGVEENFVGLSEGRSCASKITLFDASAFSCQIAAQVPGFDPKGLVPDKDLKRYDRYSLMTLMTADELWINAKLADAPYEKSRMGIILGVGIGGMGSMEENHKNMLVGKSKKVSPFTIPLMITNIAPGHVAMRYGIRGVNYTVTSACASGTHAIGEAYRMIKDGLQDCIITGGVESSITPLGIAGFGTMKTLSTSRNEQPEKASRPFDVDRDGFLMGEGSGLLVLEDMKKAEKRGANILGEITGYGFSCDAYHMTALPEDGGGAIQCMTMALESANLEPEQIQYINAHGTSTPMNDPIETRAIKKVFESHAKDSLVVSSTKSMTGHLLGGAGGVETVFLALAIEKDFIPPTINLDNPDPKCDLDYCANVGRSAKIDNAMSNSFGFGGTNASIIVSKIH